MKIININSAYSVWIRSTQTKAERGSIGYQPITAITTGSRLPEAKDTGSERKRIWALKILSHQNRLHYVQRIQPRTFQNSATEEIPIVAMRKCRQIRTVVPRGEKTC